MADVDVLVIGGGPAGSTAAAILAREGFSVTIVEKETFPRHHIGEALQPAAIEMLDLHLGIKDRIEAAGFQKKFGAMYEWGESNERWTVLFDGRLEADLPHLTTEKLLANGYEHTFHVERNRFDTILLEAAVERGVSLVKAEVVRPLVEGDAVVGAEIRHPDGRTEAVRSRYLVDTSGQSCFLGRRFGLVKALDDLQQMSIYGYFDGCDGIPGALHRHATLIVSVPEGWLWFIPQTDRKTSIGLVTHEKAKPTEEEFLAILARSSLPMGQGKLVEEDGARCRYIRNWSYGVKRVAGDGWIACGDASGFVDPILSGGVEFAIRGAANAAMAVAKILGNDGWDANEVRAFYTARLIEERDAYLKLARYWYGNNRSVQGFFWEAHRAIPADALSIDMPLRAFQYLSTGRFDADRHYKVFIEWQERKIMERLGVDKAALKAAIASARSKVLNQDVLSQPV